MAMLSSDGELVFDPSVSFVATHSLEEGERESGNDTFPNPNPNPDPNPNPNLYP